MAENSLSQYLALAKQGIAEYEDSDDDNTSYPIHNYNSNQPSYLGMGMGLGRETNLNGHTVEAYGAHNAAYTVDSDEDDGGIVYVSAYEQGLSSGSPEYLGHNGTPGGSSLSASSSGLSKPVFDTYSVCLAHASAPKAKNISNARAEAIMARDSFVKSTAGSARNSGVFPSSTSPPENTVISSKSMSFMPFGNDDSEQSEHDRFAATTIAKSSTPVSEFSVNHPSNKGQSTESVLRKFMLASVGGINGNGDFPGVTSLNTPFSSAMMGSNASPFASTPFGTSTSSLASPFPTLPPITATSPTVETSQTLSHPHSYTFPPRAGISGTFPHAKTSSDFPLAKEKTNPFVPGAGMGAISASASSVTFTTPFHHNTDLTESLSEPVSLAASTVTSPSASFSLPLPLTTPRHASEMCRSIEHTLHSFPLANLADCLFANNPAYNRERSDPLRPILSEATVMAAAAGLIPSFPSPYDSESEGIDKDAYESDSDSDLDEFTGGFYVPPNTTADLEAEKSDLGPKMLTNTPVMSFLPRASRQTRKIRGPSRTARIRQTQAGDCGLLCYTAVDFNDNRGLVPCGPNNERDQISFQAENYGYGNEYIDEYDDDVRSSIRSYCNSDVELEDQCTGDKILPSPVCSRHQSSLSCKVHDRPQNSLEREEEKPSETKIINNKENYSPSSSNVIVPVTGVSNGLHSLQSLLPNRQEADMKFSYTKPSSLASVSITSGNGTNSTTATSLSSRRTRGSSLTSCAKRTLLRREREDRKSAEWDRCLIAGARPIITALNELLENAVVSTSLSMDIFAPTPVVTALNEFRRNASIRETNIQNESRHGVQSNQVNSQESSPQFMPFLSLPALPMQTAYCTNILSLCMENESLPFPSSLLPSGSLTSTSLLETNANQINLNSGTRPCSLVSKPSNSQYCVTSLKPLLSLSYIRHRLDTLESQLATTAANSAPKLKLYNNSVYNLCDAKSQLNSKENSQDIEEPSFSLDLPDMTTLSVIANDETGIITPDSPAATIIPSTNDTASVFSRNSNATSTTSTFSFISLTSPAAAALPQTMVEDRRRGATPFQDTFRCKKMRRDHPPFPPNELIATGYKRQEISPRVPETDSPSNSHFINPEDNWNKVVPEGDVKNQTLAGIVEDELQLPQQAMLYKLNGQLFVHPITMASMNYMATGSSYEAKKLAQLKEERRTAIPEHVYRIQMQMEMQNQMQAMTLN